MQAITQVILRTGTDGRAEFVETPLPLDGGHAHLRLSELLPTAGMQWRASPVGYRSAMHCTTEPQWVFILSGVMEIGLADETVRRFGAGEHFFSNDTLPAGAEFDPQVHGHWSRQVGDQPLVTLFVKV